MDLREYMAWKKREKKKKRETSESKYKDCLDMCRVVVSQGRENNYNRNFDDDA